MHKAVQLQERALEAIDYPDTRAETERMSSGPADDLLVLRF